MSRAHVALDQLRQLTDGTPADLAALLEEVVVACPIAGPWREVRIGLSPSWSRECVVRTARGDQFPALVELAASPEGAWAARCGGIGAHQRVMGDAEMGGGLGGGDAGAHGASIFG